MGKRGRKTNSDTKKCKLGTSGVHSGAEAQRFDVRPQGDRGAAPCAGCATCVSSILQSDPSPVASPARGPGLRPPSPVSRSSRSVPGYEQVTLRLALFHLGVRSCLIGKRHLCKVHPDDSSTLTLDFAVLVFDGLRTDRRLAAFGECHTAPLFRVRITLVGLIV